MTRVFCFVSGALFVAATALAQPPAGPVGIAAGLQRSYAGVKRNLTQAAEKMPETDYLFKPTPEIRNFGQLFGHVANFQYNSCAAARGVPNPNQGQNLEQTKTTKADIVKALADS